MNSTERINMLVQGPDSSGPFAVEDLGGASEVVAALGLSNRSHLKYYRDTDPAFPQPIKHLAMGALWDLRAVKAWWEAKQRQ